MISLEHPGHDLYFIFVLNLFQSDILVGRIEGVADGLVEEFEVALSSATETETSVVVRATDALRNIVTVSGP